MYIGGGNSGIAGFRSNLFFVDMELRKCISKLIPDGYFLTHISSSLSLPCLQKSCFETTKFLNCPLYQITYADMGLKRKFMLEICKNFTAEK